MAMEHRIGRHLPKSKAPAIRRALLMFVAFAYLFVGLVHATAHVNETIAHLNKAISTVSLGIDLAETDGFGDPDSGKLSAEGDYCQVYAPTLMPVLVRVVAPTAELVQQAFMGPRLLLEDHGRLDTPPPRQLS